MDNKTHPYRVEPLAKVLLATAGLLSAVILLKLVTLFVAVADADSIVAEAKSSASGGTAAAPSMETRAVVDGLKKNNLFAPPAAKQYPVSEVMGILGDQALINGQWYKAGDRVADAKILAIEPTKVQVVWEGQTKEFSPINSTSSGGPPGPGRRGGPPAPGGPPVVVTGSRSGPPGGQGQIVQSPEEIEKMREQLRNMSPEERQRYREEMRERFSRRSR
jgi:hypothetical protein